ncbi:hypothetical protein D3C86_1556800 [compost metagenome]
MHGVVGGTAGRQQRDDPVDDHFFVDHFTQRHPLVAVAGQTRHLAGGGFGQRLTQRGIRLNERRARKLHPHELHHHLVGVGSAVKRTGTRGVI